MNGLKKLIKEFSLYSDIINTVLGIILVVFMILIFVNLSRMAVLGAFITGGFMNLMNGMKYWKDSKTKAMGLPFLMMGIILVFLGFIIIQIYPAL